MFFHKSLLLSLSVSLAASMGHLFTGLEHFQVVLNLDNPELYEKYVNLLENEIGRGVSLRKNDTEINDELRLFYSILPEYVKME